MVQIAKFPMKYLTVTQGWGSGTHAGTYAVDLAGKDTGIDNVYAPFDCKIKKIWKNGNTVWIESLDKVKWANGWVEKATMSFTHDNWVADLRVGQVIRQGQPFYQEGTAGRATGNHVHMECAKGSFVGTGWFLNRFGWWTINNMVKPNDLLLLDGTIVRNGGGIAWKRYSAPKPTPKPVAKAPVRKAAKGTATVIVPLLNVRDTPSTKGKVVGEYKKGQKFNYDSFIVANGYVWLSYVSYSKQRRYVAEGPNDGKENTVYVRGGV